MLFPLALLTSRVGSVLGAAAPTPAAVGYKRQQQRHQQREQRWLDAVANEGQHDSADHNDHQTSGSQRCQTTPNPQQPWQNQAQPAEHFADADESDQQPRELYLVW